jgi:hypothetical protein
MYQALGILRLTEGLLPAFFPHDNLLPIPAILLLVF